MYVAIPFYASREAYHAAYGLLPPADQVSLAPYDLWKSKVLANEMEIRKMGDTAVRINVVAADVKSWVAERNEGFTWTTFGEYARAKLIDRIESGDLG